MSCSVLVLHVSGSHLESSSRSAGTGNLGVCRYMPPSKVFMDDSTIVSNKRKEGGVYINEKWFNPKNTVLKFKLCTSEIELVTVSARPYYLARESSNVYVTSHISWPTYSQCTKRCRATGTTRKQQRDCRTGRALRKSPQILTSAT